MVRNLKNLYHLIQAQAAALFFSFPSKHITVIGVTGTDGKTTTVHMLYEILKSANLKASMISSVHAAIGSKVYDTGLHVTTPSCWQIQKYLRKAVDSNHKYFVLETTSHGLDQNRLANVNFEIGVLTNISHDHLDYHKTWEKYALSKLKLLKYAKTPIINTDDEKSFTFLKSKLKNFSTYGIKSGETSLQNFPLKLQFPGVHNLSNALAAAAAATKLGISKQKIIKSLNNFSGVTGRLDQVSLKQNFKVFVDFAHTPNALEKSLNTLNTQKEKDAKVIAVFGSAGKRDKIKRPIMGKAADLNSDIVILTAEDPRTEKVEAITGQIASGIKNKTLGKDLFVIPDRKLAIEYAVKLAQKGDVVGIFGKGHEKSMAYGRKEFQWDEFEVAKAAIRKKLHESKRK